MDVSKLIRDSKRVKACLKELPDNTVVALKPLKLYIPARFEERELASIGNEIYVIGVFALVTEDGFYSVSKVNAMMRIAPSSINTVRIDGDVYYEFSFRAGSTVIADMNLVKNDVITYFIFEEFIAKGKVPWYIDYNDLGGLFATSKKYAGVNIGESHEVIELIASIIARDPKNLYRQYRHSIKDAKSIVTDPPTYVPLGAIQYTATNTVTKIAGSYMSDGVVSALVNPSTRPERIESLLTK